jgi:hypothetical protein
MIIGGNALIGYGHCYEKTNILINRMRPCPLS